MWEITRLGYRPHIQKQKAWHNTIKQKIGRNIQTCYILGQYITITARLRHVSSSEGWLLPYQTKSHVAAIEKTINNYG